MRRFLMGRVLFLALTFSLIGCGREASSSSSSSDSKTSKQSLDSKTSEQSLPGKYWVEHQAWKGEIELYADGGFGRPSWGPQNVREGKWSFKDNVLTLAWDKWNPESYRLTPAFVGATGTISPRPAGGALPP
jgi:hypothetical protein